MYHNGGSPIQATDDLQTLYLLNPNNIQQPHTNVVFLNSAVRALDSHAPLPQAQQFVGFPVLSHYPHEYQTIIPSFDHNSWRSVNDPNMSLPTVPKCLSLSLSSDQTGSNKSLLNYQNFMGQSSIEMVLPRTSSGVESKPGKVMGSKYLKAAQQILDEVANVGEGVSVHDGMLVRSKDKAKIIESSINGAGEDGGAEKRTTAQRQDIQMKKAKLVAMLHEVEQRYRNYQQQMHMIVALFEQTAGIGSSKRYTQLASRTISKQFRCLKDAISSQISVLKNSLREQDVGNEDEGSRLEFSIHRFRQQSAWRTPRGLPERAVSVLRAWLFEHFLHPYPKDLDKNMMAKQTGLSRNQVSNWFINARVRLWKPMVEEMYLEEMKIHSHDQETTTGNSKKTDQEILGRQRLLVIPQNGPQHNSTTTVIPKIDRINAFQSKKHDQIMIQYPSTGGTSFAELIRSLNMENNPTSHQMDPKKSRKDIDADTDQDKYYYSPNILTSTEQKATGRFNGNGVSLTLALPPSATSHDWSPELSQHQHNLPSNSTFEFPKRILESGSSMGYENILDFQNRNNPFSAQLFPDFMA
ncbi:BEL1-like homeodomain protein 1 [Henckelia pumila]|uniref:BEL1-like homeodomain protein 1 n=1 Tax=Henckelia pumila TaxID=405737 RepID=UPI003C6E5CF0